MRRASQLTPPPRIMTSSQTLTTPPQPGTAVAGSAHERDRTVGSITLASRKFVTVMFVDIQDSTDLSRTIGPEAWWSVIADVFELMCEGVYEFGGWVANFTGDGIAAVFDAPILTGDHAGRACDSALWLRDAMRAPAAKLSSDHALELSIRIGINSGEVLTGRSAIDTSVTTRQMDTRLHWQSGWKRSRFRIGFT